MDLQTLIMEAAVLSDIVDPNPELDDPDDTLTLELTPREVSVLQLGLVHTAELTPELHDFLNNLNGKMSDAILLQKGV